MKKLLMAGLLALPLLAMGQQQASAAGGCYGLKGCFNIKICASGWLRPYCEPCCAPCQPCQPCGGCGPLGPAAGCGPCGPSCCGCPGPIPGPWYLYWPYDGVSQVAPAYANWTLESHFQTPAPTGYPYFPNPMVINGSQFAPGGPTHYAPAPVQPVGYYPGYWSGH